MDESLQELENELKRLRPRRPSAELLARLDEEFAKPDAETEANRSAGTVLIWPRLYWRTAAAAAAVAVLATVVMTTRQARRIDNKEGAQPELVAVTKTPPPAENVTAPEIPAVSPEPVADRYHPVGAASVLYDLKEDGVDTPTNSAPVHRVRYRYVDTYTWKNPTTKASLKWSVPRDEVRVIPASLH